MLVLVADWLQIMTEARFFDHVPSLTVNASYDVWRMNSAARKLIGGKLTSISGLFSNPDIQWGGINYIKTKFGIERYFVMRQPLSRSRFQILLLTPNSDVVPAAGVQADIEALPVPMIKLAASGRVVCANQIACDLLDIKADEAPLLSELMEGLGRSIADWLDDALLGRGLKHPEFLRLTRHASEIYVQVALNRSSEPGDPSLIAVLSDATELKTLEAQFVQSQKMQAIGQLAGGVAHDFNNLLTAISGHCDLLLLRHGSEHSPDDQNYSDLMQINQNANRAAALVAQLLAFSRKQTLRLEHLDIRDMLSDFTHLLNRLVGEKVELCLNYDPALHRVRADKRQLEQVLMNLVVNARDSMPQGGKIVICTAESNIKEPFSRDRVVVEAGQYVSLTVSDQGCGIAADKLQKIFEPFYTTKRTGEGTGLGLSTVYGIVKQTGGYIFVDSEVEKGTKFTLLLPASADGAPPAPTPLPRPPKPRRKVCENVILLVEDETTVRTFAARALQLQGFKVIEACSGEEALSTLSDQSLKIDVFVTDVVMPGLDGPSWVKKALADRPNVGVVFVSGYAEDSFQTHQARIPNSVFLPKPFSLEQLTTTVSAQMH